MFDDRDGSAVVAKQVARPCGARAERPRALKACAEQRASLADVASVRGASRRGVRRVEAVETKRRRVCTVRAAGLSRVGCAGCY